MTHTHNGPPHEGGLKPYGLLALVVVATVAGETTASYLAGILALRVDAFHTLGDGLAIGLVAWFQATHHRRTEGSNQRLEARTRVIIGLLITGAGIYAGIESIERWRHPSHVSGPIMIAAATVSALLNRVMLRVLGSCLCGVDRHLRAHVRSDIWISVGVAGSGLGVAATGFWWLEPATSSVISALVINLGGQVVFDLHKDKDEPVAEGE